MDTVIRECLNQAKIGRKQSYKNLAIYPLLSTYSVSLDYLTLDEALSRGLIEVVEVGREPLPRKNRKKSYQAWCGCLKMEEGVEPPAGTIGEPTMRSTST